MRGTTLHYTQVFTSVTWIKRHCLLYSAQELTGDSQKWNVPAYTLPPALFAMDH